MKKALIVASGLRGITGHNFFYTQAVKQELERRGFDVTVFANKHAPAEFIEKTGFKPVFSLGTYDNIPLNGKLSDLVYTYLQSGIYAYELQAAMRDAGNINFDLAFFHTVADFEIIALSRFLKKHQLCRHLFLMLRITPGFQTLSKWKTVLHPYWRVKPHYLNSIYQKTKKRFTLLTDSELLTKDFSAFYRQPIITCPIPLEHNKSKAETADEASADSILERYNLKRDERICFGFMGDSRNGKGFSLLPRMIRKVLQSKSEKIKFVIQCPNTEYDNVGIPDGLKELQDLAARNDNIVLIREKLSDKDYLKLFQYLDAVMIPYTHDVFREGTSNIFAESVALGKPVVISGDTWMSHELKKYCGGIEFEKGNAEDFAEKVLLMTAESKKLQAKARNYSSEWVKFHNVENLVDILLKEGNLQ